ncbi:hypothetical protein [Corynebacterium durum]
MGTNKEPLNPEDGTIYTADGQRVDRINDISDLLWRFDDAPGDGLENPAGTKVREPNRVHDLDSLHDAVRDWESEATAPWAGNRPCPEREGEVCTEVTIGEVREDVDAVAVQFTSRIKAGGDVHLLSVATILLSVYGPGTIAAALAWGEPEQGFTASLGRAEVKDNNRAVACILDQVHAFVRRVSSAPDTHSKHAWGVVSRAADMMVHGLVHGGGTPSWVTTFTGVTWYPENWLVMLAVLKNAINHQTVRSQGVMPSVQIQDTPKVPDFVDPQTSTFQVVQALKVRGYPKMRYVIDADKSRDGKAQGLWSLSITAPHASGKANIYPTLALAQAGVSTADVFRMCASAADFMSAANAVGDGTPTEYSISFAADPSDLAWWKRHFDEAQDDAQEVNRDEGQP